MPFYTKLKIWEDDIEAEKKKNRIKIEAPKSRTGKTY